MNVIHIHMSNTSTVLVLTWYRYLVLVLVQYQKKGSIGSEHKYGGTSKLMTTTNTVQRRLVLFFDKVWC
jgi:hypothetical protein